MRLPLGRHQIPVRSPLSGSAVVAGLRAAASGERAREGEARVRALLSARYAPAAALLTGSGTTALTATIRAVLEEHRDVPVALPAYACYDLATVADGAGARVLLYDVDPHTLAPDLEQLEAALRAGAGVVVVAHFYGYPVDFTAVNRLASTTGAAVIEDAAQAAGAILNGRAAGTLGSLAVLSFGRGKGLTGGSGGALLAHDEAGVRVLRRASRLLEAPRRGWREVVTSAAQLLLEHPNLYGIPASLPFLRLGETVYRGPAPLRGPAAASCAMIAATWERASEEVETRRRNAVRLLAAVRGERGGGLIPVQTAPGARPGYLRLPVLAPANAGAPRLGIMPGYPQALCDLAPFKERCLNQSGEFPGARLLADRLCTLPTHGRLDMRDLARLEEWIHQVGAT